MIALVIVAAFLVFVILDVILHLSFKALKKDWKIGLVHVGLMAAFLLSLYTADFLLSISAVSAGVQPSFS